MTNTRTRILDASTELFRRQGMSGTGLKQIAEVAKAPFGSIYHFFPGGKDDLAGETIRRAGGEYRDLVLAFFAGPDDLLTNVETAFAAAATVLVETDYADACPIATVALEVASTNEPLRQATAEVFADWIEAGGRHLEQRGVPPEAARGLIIGFITSLEGAFVLARSLRSTEPLEAAGHTVRAAVREALGTAA
ncbi:TetR/AcrR family transcriptional regulator [Nocardioides panzhihuensis]|uniref:AcrR family transcriptional regulator n=1 Tax=Nocardioides panzhihuensis TaxID=860243 RepID=A0A7Z0DP34_9ACTN|nr:TetR/AcrR family transcriptional regulator [Nocardioides panzhihuensis]NYI79088.1 AcrR family transcriptional regulator [Nocardioides panzhihuensis]